MSRKDQSGFIMMAVITVIVIAVLGLIGWSLYTNYYSKQNSVTTSNSQNPKPATSSTATVQHVDPNAGYFVIKEWGVRFKSASGLDGLEYALRFSDSIAVFSTPQITAVDSRCGTQDARYSGIGSLGRYAVNAEQPVLNAWFLATINGYKYYYGGAGGADCVYDANNKPGQDLLHSEEQNFSNSVKSLEAEKPTYLDIKELGIKILISPQISDAVYSIRPTQSYDTTKEAYISAQTLIDSETDGKGYCDTSSAP